MFGNIEGSRSWSAVVGCQRDPAQSNREVARLHYPVNTVGVGLKLEYSLSEFLYQLKFQLQIYPSRRVRNADLIFITPIRRSTASHCPPNTIPNNLD